MCGMEMEEITVVVEPRRDTSIVLQACQGSTVTYQGTQLNPGETQVFNLTTLAGCDSLVTVEVEEVNVFTAEEFFEVQDGPEPLRLEEEGGDGDHEPRKDANLKEAAIEEVEENQRRHHPGLLLRGWPEEDQRLEAMHG